MFSGLIVWIFTYMTTTGFTPTDSDMSFPELVHFRDYEFEFPDRMDVEFLRVLDRARERANVPFYITSDYREAEDSSHSSGKAVDLHAHRAWVKFKIVEAAMAEGIERIGVYDRHVHLDMDDSRPYPVLWIGDSQ